MTFYKVYHKILVKKLEDIYRVKKLLNFRLFLFISLSLIAGILSAYFFFFKNTFNLVLCVFVFFLLNFIYLAFFSKSRLKTNSIFVSVFIVFFALGSMLFTFQITNYVNADLGGHYYSVVGTVDEIQNIDGGNKLVLKDVAVKGNVNGKLHYNVALYVYGENNFDLGDVLSFDSYLNDISLKYEGRFSPYNIESGVKYSASSITEHITVYKTSKTIFQIVNCFIRDNLHQGLDDTQFSIAYAMLTGNSDFMDSEVISSYRLAGVAHIFAVSGLHVGFVSAILGFILGKLKVNRTLKAIIITFALLFYSGVCGFSSSSIRASVMSSVYLFSAIKGNKYDGLTSISISALIILLISPVQLFCVGFQLSFVVVLGMMLLTKPLAKTLSFLPNKISSPLAKVLSAQIAGIPVCLSAFGQVSAIAIVMNLLFVPIVGMIFTVLLVCLFISALIGIHSIVFFISNILLYLVNALITAFDYRIFIIGPIILGAFNICYYLAIIISSGFINLSTLVKRVSVVVLSLSVILGGTALTVKEYNSNKLYVCGIDNVCASVLKTPSETVMIISYAERYFSTSRLKRIAEYENIRNIDTLVILDGFNVDLQELVSKFINLFTLDEVIYAGERNNQQEIAFYKSFPLLTLKNVCNQVSFNTDKKLQFSLGLDGCLISTKIKGKSLAVLSAFRSKSPNYSELKNGYDYLIGLDLNDRIFEISNSKNEISYLRSPYYSDAQSEGNLKIII